MAGKTNGKGKKDKGKGDKYVTDTVAVIAALRAEIVRRVPSAVSRGVARQIARDKAAYLEEWRRHDSKGRVNPVRFFDELRRQMPADAVTVLDDGNHTFLTAELFSLGEGSRLLTPTDFNAMGYAVPAAIGAKLAQPDREVFAIVGDGCFMMTCMEIVTAATQALGITYFVFRDGHLSQIAQAQEMPYNRKPCTVLGEVDFRALAAATGAAYVPMPDEASIGSAITEAKRLAAAGKPVIVDIAIDYSKRTAFTTGTTKSTFQRFPFMDRMRFAGRALLRKVKG